MEELVRYQGNHVVAQAALSGGEGGLRQDVVVRAAVLEPRDVAERLPHHAHEDRVGAAHGPAHQAVLRPDDLLHGRPQVPRDRRRVRVRWPHRESDPLAGRLQRVEAVRSQKRLCVGELMVIRRRIRAAARAFERRGHLPARRQREPHFGRPLQLALLVEKQVRAEELSEIVHDACERQIDRVGEVVELDRHAVALARRDTPGVLVVAVPKECRARGAPGAEAAHVARIVLDLVGAGTPRRQRHVQRIVAARRKFGFDVNQVRGGRGDRDLVFHGLRRQRDGDQEGDQPAHQVTPRAWVECRVHRSKQSGPDG